VGRATSASSAAAAACRGTTPTRSARGRGHSLVHTSQELLNDEAAGTGFQLDDELVWGRGALPTGTMLRWSATVNRSGGLFGAAQT